MIAALLFPLTNNAELLNVYPQSIWFVRISDADAANLKINFGRKEGMDVKGVFALINSARQLKGVEVGKISLMSDFAIFTVDKKRADEVVSIGV